MSVTFSSTMKRWRCTETTHEYSIEVDRGYRGRYNQRGNRGQGRGIGVPSGSEELKV